MPLYSTMVSSSLGWLLEDPIDHSAETKNVANFNDGSVHGGENVEGNKMVKKINHNASERDRRKRISELYSTLRSLLPHEDQSKKLSIPITVSRVLDYIPVLQQEVERLVEKKENLTMKSSSYINSNNVVEVTTSPVVVSVTPISDREIVFHMSMRKVERRVTISDAIERSEREGFTAINASCFESFDGRVFYSLHLKAQVSEVITMDAEALKMKLWPFLFLGQ